jgi:hypothetical protein
VDGNISIIEHEVLEWAGVTPEAGRFGAVAFLYGKRAFGHIHRNRVAAPPVVTGGREEIISRGRARPHRAWVKGYTSYPLGDQEDFTAVLEIPGRDYDRAKAAAEQRRGSPKG